MERKQAAPTLFLLALAAIALYFCYVITKPFLGPVFLAVMLAIVFYPVHLRLSRRVFEIVTRLSFSLQFWFCLLFLSRVLDWSRHPRGDERALSVT